MFVIGQTGQATVSWKKAPPECFCWHLHPSPCDMTLHPHLACEPLKRKPAARGKRAARAPSTFGWFSRLPWLGYADGSVAPAGCPLVLVAARAPFGVIREGAQSDSRRATTPDGRADVETAGLWPRTGERALLRASRTVKFTRSVKAVFKCPEKPKR